MPIKGEELEILSEQHFRSSPVPRSDFQVLPIGRKKGKTFTGMDHSDTVSGNVSRFILGDLEDELSEIKLNSITM